MNRTSLAPSPHNPQIEPAGKKRQARKIAEFEILSQNSYK